MNAKNLAAPPFPSSRHLLTAFTATVAAAIAAIPMYSTPARSVLQVSAFAWAPVWAVCICSFDLGTMISDSICSIVGACFGALSGIFAYWLASQACLTEYSTCAIATILLIPPALLGMASHPHCHLPFRRILRWDVALLCMYPVASFANGHAYWMAWNLVLGFSFGSVCAVVCVVVMRYFLSELREEHGIVKAISEFRSSHTNWLEGLRDSMGSCREDHGPELRYREMQSFWCLSELIEALKSVKRSADVHHLRSIRKAAIDIHTHLLGLSAASGNLSEVCFGELMKKIVLILDPATCKVHVAWESVCEHPQQCEAFAMHCIAELGRLVEEFRTLVQKRKVWDHFLTLNWRACSNVLRHVLKPSKYRIGQLSFAWRAVLGGQILAQCLIGFQQANLIMGIAPYLGWSQTAFIVCFLPTLGQAVIASGGRRFAGTLLASALAAITACTESVNDSTIFSQMLIVVFVGKLFSLHPNIQSGGIIFILVWMAECTPAQTPLTVLTLIVYRQLCSCIGIAFAMLCSLLLWPSFSTTAMRKTICATLHAIARITQPDANVDLHALSKLHRTYANLARECSESRRERWVLERRWKGVVRIPCIIKAEPAVYQLAHSAYLLASTLHAQFKKGQTDQLSPALNMMQLQVLATVQASVNTISELLTNSLAFGDCKPTTPEMTDLPLPMLWESLDPSDRTSIAVLNYAFKQFQEAHQDILDVLTGEHIHPERPKYIPDVRFPLISQYSESMYRGESNY